MFTIIYPLPNHKLKIQTKAKYDLGKKGKKKRKIRQKLGKFRIIFGQHSVFLNVPVGAMAVWCCWGHYSGLMLKKPWAPGVSLGAAGSVGAGSVVGGCSVVRATCSVAPTEVV